MYFIYNHNLTSKKKYFMGAPIVIWTFYRCNSNILPALWPFHRLQGWTESGVGTKYIKTNGKRVLEVFIQWYCHVEFRVCFAKYENDIFLLCDTSNAFIGAFGYSKIHFHPSGPFKSIKTMLKFLHILLGLSPVLNRYHKDDNKKGTT